jgi:hypothetical protein
MKRFPIFCRGQSRLVLENDAENVLEFNPESGDVRVFLGQRRQILWGYHEANYVKLPLNDDIACYDNRGVQSVLCYKVNDPWAKPAHMIGKGTSILQVLVRKGDECDQRFLHFTNTITSTPTTTIDRIVQLKAFKYEIQGLSANDYVAHPHAMGILQAMIDGYERCEFEIRMRFVLNRWATAVLPPIDPERPSVPYDNVVVDYIPRLIPTIESCPVLP